MMMMNVIVETVITMTVVVTAMKMKIMMIPLGN